MIKISPFIIYTLIICSSITDLFSQSNYSIQSIENLQKLKAEAVKESDFIKADGVKKEIEHRNSEQNKINELQTDLEKKVKTEDYTGATETQKSLDILISNKAKKEAIRKQIITSAINENYEEADKLKKELSDLTFQSDQIIYPNIITTVTPSKIVTTEKIIDKPIEESQKNEQTEIKNQPKKYMEGILYNYVSGLPVGFKVFKRGTVLSIGYGENYWASSIFRLNVGIVIKRHLYVESGVLFYNLESEYIAKDKQEDYLHGSWDLEIGYVGRINKFAFSGGFHSASIDCAQISVGIGYYF